MGLKGATASVKQKKLGTLNMKLELHFQVNVFLFKIFL